LENSGAGFGKNIVVQLKAMGMLNIPEPMIPLFQLRSDAELSSLYK